MLHDEIIKRTHIDLQVLVGKRQDHGDRILIGKTEDFRRANLVLPEGLEVPAKTDGFALWMDCGKEVEIIIYCVGHDERTPGLIGFRNDKLDFDNPVALDSLYTVNQPWKGYLGARVGYWTGYIEAPYTGEIAFSAEAYSGIRLEINNKMIIDGIKQVPLLTGNVKMVKGNIYPIRIWYFHTDRLSSLKLYWFWEGKEKKIIDAAYLYHGPENNRYAMKFMK